jgi:tRNA dimethylallyltransferase
MVDNGVLEEAKHANEVFCGTGKSKDDLNLLPAYKAHGLREIISYLNGDITKEEAIAKAQQVTRNYAKRQFTWWRGWSKSLNYEQK